MSSLIKLTQIENGVDLQNRIISVENTLTNGNFEVNEMNAKLGVIQEVFMVGFTDHVNNDSDFIMEVSGNTAIYGKLNVENNVNIGGDLSVNSILDVSGTIITTKNFIFHTNSTEKVIIDTSGVKFLNSDPSYCAFDISATSALKIPIGTEQERPTDVKAGQIRYNTTNSQFEGYNTTDSWQGLGGVIDIDQDTFILAETNPKDDNDEIQIFTASFERMKVDACGNIQMFNSNPTYPSLDISSTGSLAIPRGSINERPTTDSNAPRSIRFNTDTSLCEVYTESNIWSGIPVYKSEQPPSLLNISQTRLSETVTVNWEKFADIYKDVFDGKCYPIYLQTFVDISFTDISNTSTGEWKTIIIGPGNYDETGNSTEPLTSFLFNSIVETKYSDNNKSDDSGYSSLTFTDKPTSTIDLPIFTQEDSFDLRIYGVNKSGTLPNYNYIYNVQLKQTEEPGEIDVILFELFGKTNFQVDLSFNLDSGDTSIINMDPPDGISITRYDVSFILSESKSLENRTHAGNQITNWIEPTSLSKEDLIINNLFPGAKYNIQIRAQNALKLDDSTDNGYKYGDYGDVFTASGFTNNNGDLTGTSTTEYIDTGDLNSVSQNLLQFTLENTNNINCYVNGTDNPDTRTIGNSTSYINITGNSEFYVNYGLQGTDMTAVNDLVQATVQIKVSDTVTSEQTITYDGTNNPSGVSVSTINISNGGSSIAYQFSSGGAYSDKSNVTNYNDGFVYSSTLSRTDSNTLNSLFVNNFQPSTDYYNLLYSITTQNNNNNKQIDENGNTTISDDTSNFFVDDYLSTPVITWTQDPIISVDNSTTLFGIPSVTSINLQYAFTVSNFANHIIPRNSDDVHSYVDKISKNSYEFITQENKNIFSNNDYNISFNSSNTDIINGRYDDNTTTNVEVYVFYLNNSGTIPTITNYVNNDKNISDIGHIFKDTVTTYTTFDLYTFDGYNIVGTTAIDTDHTNFENEYSTYISTMLLYFNDRFVSGGYNVGYTSTLSNLYPFGDWSTSTNNYAVNGPNYTSYSNTGINGFKWIVLDVSSKKNGNNVDLTSFKINDTIHSSKTFGTDYEAYIYQDGVFGALNNNATTNTAWFDDPEYNTNISDAKNRPADPQGGALQFDADNGTIGTDAYVKSSIATVYLIVGLPQNSTEYFTYS